jgi:hypothetical protein
MTLIQVCRKDQTDYVAGAWKFVGTSTASLTGSSQMSLSLVVCLGRGKMHHPVAWCTPRAVSPVRRYDNAITGQQHLRRFAVNAQVRWSVKNQPHLT